MYALVLCRYQFAFASSAEADVSIVPFEEHLEQLIDDSVLLNLPLGYHLGTCELKRNELATANIVKFVEQLDRSDVCALMRREVSILIKYVEETWHKKIVQAELKDLPINLRMDFPY